jgi:predicted DNA-binding mobile mystery protein A
MRMVPYVHGAATLDAQLANPDHRAAFRPAMYDWSGTVRGVTGVPIVTLAKRLGITKQAVSKLEQHEADGTISLAKLEMLADALDCDFVYGFMPRESFESTAQNLQNRQDKARQAKRKLPYPD